MAKYLGATKQDISNELAEMNRLKRIELCLKTHEMESNGSILPTYKAKTLALIKQDGAT